MKKQETDLTTSQFAAIHQVNPRTLHYYDSVGLFSPERKGENQYRYYTSLCISLFISFIFSSASSINLSGPGSCT